MVARVMCREERFQRRNFMHCYHRECSECFCLEDRLLKAKTQAGTERTCAIEERTRFVH